MDTIAKLKIPFIILLTFPFNIYQVRVFLYLNTLLAADRTNRNLTFTIIECKPDCINLCYIV